MGGFCQGKPIQQQEVISPEMKAYRQRLLALALQHMGQGNTQMPQGMPMSAPVGQGMYNASNLMSLITGGQPYQQGQSGFGTGTGTQNPFGFGLPLWFGQQTQPTAPPTNLRR
jgi:hypothetical protein